MTQHRVVISHNDSGQGSLVPCSGGSLRPALEKVLELGIMFAGALLVPSPYEVLATATIPSPCRNPQETLCATTLVWGSGVPPGFPGDGAQPVILWMHGVLLENEVALGWGSNLHFQGHEHSAFVHHCTTSHPLRTLSPLPLAILLHGASSWFDSPIESGAVVCICASIKQFLVWAGCVGRSLGGVPMAAT